MRVLIVDNESLHITELSDLFSGHQIDICSYQQIPDKWYDLVVLSWWSHYSVLQKPFHYDKEVELIKNTKIPLLWICLWCQLIAHAFGSRLTKMPEKLVKEIEIRNSLDGRNYKVFESHKYAITKLWKGIKWIAKSKYGYEIIKHKTRPIRWFQFHPEVDEEHTQGKKILDEVLHVLWTSR